MLLQAPTLSQFAHVEVHPADPEQYLIADETSNHSMEKAKRVLDWEPSDDDIAMLIAAYDSSKNPDSQAS